MSKTIGIEEAEKAYHYLAKTDEEVAQAKTRVMAAEHAAKTAKAICFLEAKGTVAEREAQSLVAHKYIECLNEFEFATLDYETLKAKRKRAELAIEMFRTLEASRRAGA